MIEWRAEAVVCAVQRHGENAAIVTLMTADHGLVAGYVPGGMGKRRRPIFDIGNGVRASWQARLADQLGRVDAELITPRAASALASPQRLAALNTFTALTASALPERQAMPGVYAGLVAALDVVCAMGDVPLEALGAALVRYEMGLLTHLGYGLDLSQCAATGSLDDLVYVSPRTGRAVSAHAGADYASRLLPLPAFMLGSQAGPADADTLMQGLQLTGYFLEKMVFAQKNADLPAARARFVEFLNKARAAVD